jgi:transposase
MAMGRQGARQDRMMVLWDELPRSPGPVFYDRLQTVLRDAGFDRFAENLCQPFYARRMGAPSLPPVLDPGRRRTKTILSSLTKPGPRPT